MSFNDQIICGIKAATSSYAEDEILIPQMPNGMLPAFLKIEIQLVAASLMDADNDILQWHLSPKSQDGILGIGDQECLAADTMTFEIVTSGGGLASLRFEYEFPAPLLVSFTKLYFGVISTENANVHYRIHWVPRASKVPQRDNVVSQLQF